jgi:hypothetical protein
MDGFEILEYFAQSELNSRSKHKRYVVAKYVEGQESGGTLQGLNRLVTGYQLASDWFCRGSLPCACFPHISANMP